MQTTTSDRGRTGPDDVDDATEPAASRSWRTAAIAVVALLVGVGVTLAVTAGSGSDPVVDDRGGAAPDRAVDLDVEALAAAGFEDLPPPPTEIPTAPATDPTAAVEGFLAAEANRAYDASFDFLSAAAQETFGGSPATWIAVHADVLPPVTGFVVQDVADAGDGSATVTTTVGFEPSLDEVVGLVPAQAEVAWAVVAAEDGSFGVDIDASAFAPRYLPDDEAAQAVADWVAARQAGDRTGEWGGTLLGVEQPVRDLLDAPDGFTIGAPGPLGPVEANPFTTAFGDDALVWAREVPVSGPVDLRAVVAPVGSAWRVIGVLPPAPGSG